MPVFVTPNSNGEDAAPLREDNPCHEPHSGRFARKGSGNCAGASTGLPEAVRSETLRRLVEDNPNFNIEDALEAGGPGFRAQYHDLQAKVPDAQNAMMTRMTRVLGEIGGQHMAYTQLWEGEGIRATVAPPKGVRRLIEKAALDYDGNLTDVKDAVRAAIAVDSPDDVARVSNAIRDHFEVVREKNRFVEPVNGGYRDLLFNVRFRNGLVGEVQVHVKPMLKAKETAGHRLYTEMRRYAAMGGDAARETVLKLQQQSQALYSGAWSLALAMAVTHHR